jgi:hypothetical protein
MYLVKLYKQHKGWFAVVILFAFGQLFINYKNGVMVSPFYNYDMYSYSTMPKQQYEVLQISVNGKELQPKNFSPNEWDNLVQPIVFFDKQQDWNSFLFHSEVQKFLPVQDSALYVNTILKPAFSNWYKKQVLHIAHIKDTNSTITIHRNSFLLAQQFLHTK